MKKRKLLLSLASVSAFTVPVLSAKCGNTENWKFFEETDMKDVNGNVVKAKDADGNEITRKTITTLADIKSNPEFKIGDHAYKDADKKEVFRTMFITDEGSVTDESFNQSGLEAVHKLSYELGINKKARSVGEGLNQYSEPGKGELEASYKNAIDEGYKYIVVCGFYHTSSLKTLFLDKDYYEKIVKDDIKFILIDDNPIKTTADLEAAKTRAEKLEKQASRTEEEEKELKGLKTEIEFTEKAQKYIIPALFTTARAGYMAGYGLGKYFEKKYPKDEDAAKRTIGAFGGIPWPAVSDFITGLFHGIIDSNEEIKKAGGKATTTSLKEDINLNSGFEVNQKAEQAIEAIKTSTAWFPVAGSLTVKAKEDQLADSTAGHKFLIGVDADQAKSMPEGRFFTSVLKQIGQAVYNILGNLYTYGNLSKMPQYAEWDTKRELGAFGYSTDNPLEQYVGVAKAHLLKDEDDKLAQESLDAAIKYYKENLTEIEKRVETRKKEVTTKEFPQWFSDYTNYLAKKTKE